jgi:Rieske Fe-S protein
MEQDTDRRSFLAWAIVGLGAIFSAIIGVPIVCFAMDPRHRKGPKSNFKLVDGIKLDELTLNSPKQGVISDTRIDGWTLYPNDVIGRVWVVPIAARPAGLSTREAVENFNQDEAKKAAYLIVFTTICPHLGCSVNVAGAGAGFACPCHGATFTLSGARAHEANPAERGMDTLEWEIDAEDPDFNRIKVKYQNFVTSIKEKKPVG